MGDRKGPDKSTRPLTERLAVVYADPLRLRIITELNKRPMSASEFFREFGGDSSSRVSRHFRRMKEYGWLVLERTATGGKRRSSVEDFYRATGPAVFDNQSWAEVPDPIRRVYSWYTFEQLADCVTRAMKAGTFDARSDRHLTWTPYLLDQAGWDEVIAKVDALFKYSFEEQERAELRLATTGEQPIRATVALAAFESPASAPVPADPGPAVTGPSSEHAEETGKEDSGPPPLLRISKVFDSPVRLKIVTELNKLPMSASGFFRRFGGSSASNVAGHFAKLEEYGWLTLDRIETPGTRRGRPEDFYRATGPAVFDNRSWAQVPDSVKTLYSWRTFEQFAESVTAAMKAGAFDARDDRHFSWNPVLLDEEGWKRIVAKTDELFEFLFVAAERAKQRMAKAEAEPIPMTIALAVFESPEEKNLRAP